MTAQLDHTIVYCHDMQASAEFLARVLGSGSLGTFGRFVTLEIANEVTLAFDRTADVRPQHYAFLVEDEEFEPILERVRSEGLEIYADPRHEVSGQINTRHQRRGFYFDSPEGHNLEVITRSKP